MQFDSISVDWHVSMARAREVLGRRAVISGNVDPAVLYSARKGVIATAVHRCIDEAQIGVSRGPGASDLSTPLPFSTAATCGPAVVSHHVLNLGHGVEKDMSEEAVQTLVDAAKSYTNKE
jgi:uroporphyrinogen-III decarboxylase